MNVQWIAHNGKGRGSRIIKWATRGKYSHISVRIIDMPDWVIERMQDKFGYDLTKDHEFEAIQFVGVRHQPFVPSDNQAWFNIKGFEWTETPIFLVVHEACRLVGCKYDWRGIGGFVTRRNVHHPLKWFCSEYGCRLLSMVKIVIMNMPDHWITPNVGSASPALVCVKEATS